MLRYVLRPDQDAFGHLLKDFAAGRPVVEVVERDDGCVFTGDPSYYLAPFREWWPQERRAMRYVRGCVLDLGCGAGRVGVHLQSRGFDVVGIDVSPLAVELARERGASDARLGTLDTAIKTGELFGTILLLGNNLGLLAVLPTDVVNAADRGPISERAVRPASVVVVEPVWQRLVALSM